MIDIGTNLLHGQFDADRSAVLQRAKAAGVETLMLTATDIATAHALQIYIEQIAVDDIPNLYCTAGVHPHDADSAPEDLAAQLEHLARHPSVVAIGEAGLDYHRNFSPKAVQQAVFEVQAQLAAKLDKPLFVHDRDSEGDVLKVLQDAQINPENVTVHCFTGTGEVLDAYLAAGYWIGITGWVCDRRRGQALRDIVTRIPLERLLVETDAPFLLPHNVPKDIDHLPNGRRNEPAYLTYVVAQLAELYGTTPERLAEQTARNAERAFRLNR